NQVLAEVVGAGQRQAVFQLVDPGSSLKHRGPLALAAAAQVLAEAVEVLQETHDLSSRLRWGRFRPFCCGDLQGLTGKRARPDAPRRFFATTPSKGRDKTPPAPWGRGVGGEGARHSPSPPTPLPQGARGEEFCPPAFRLREGPGKNCPTKGSVLHVEVGDIKVGKGHDGRRHLAILAGADPRRRSAGSDRVGAPLRARPPAGRSSSA